MWETLQELGKDIVAPKTVTLMTAAAVPTPAAVVPTPAELSRDAQDWQLSPTEFQRWHRFYGFTVDACSDDKGQNSHLQKFWSKERSCVDV